MPPAPPSTVTKFPAPAAPPASVQAAPAATTPAAPALPAKPTGDQRVAIRSLLDRHFDDGVGEYLDRMTDEKIAMQVGVAARVVSDIREAAYGPIRADPALSQLRSELAALDNTIAIAARDAQKAMAHAADTLKALRDKTDSLAARVNLKLAGG